jgi:hypothetical protein
MVVVSVGKVLVGICLSFDAVLLVSSPLGFTHEATALLPSFQERENSRILAPGYARQTVSGRLASAEETAQYRLMSPLTHLAITQRARQSRDAYLSRRPERVVSFLRVPTRVG